MFFTVRMLTRFICGLAMIFATIAVTSEEASAGAAAIPLAIVGSNSANASSWLGGAHGGYNWSQGGVVFGFETDIQGIHLNSPMVGGLQYIPPITPPPTDFAATNALIERYGTARARLGATVGSFLFFVTGGLAYGDVELRSAFSGYGLTAGGQSRETKVGGVAGAGFEYMVLPNIMLTFNYQYVDLGKVNIGSSAAGSIGCCTSTSISQSATVHAQFQTAMIGMSWLFAPAASGSPWTGAYAGGHFGGAWGNNASALYNGSSIFTGD